MPAKEEPKMWTPAEEERERHEARWKAQLDYNTAMKVARMEGFEEGYAKGQKIGPIHYCQRLLKRRETPTEQLLTLSIEDLTRMADDLQQQVLSQR
jgi:hypothetical protein